MKVPSRLVVIVAVAVVGAFLAPAAGAQQAEDANSGPAPNTVGAYGNARALGPNEPAPAQGGLVGLAPTPSAGGYWLAAADGGVFSYGDAEFVGSAAPAPEEIVGLAAHPGGRGYWLVGSAGGVFPFGAAGDFGSLNGQPLQRPVVAIAATPTGEGYWLVAADGGVFAFGDAGFSGSLADRPLNAPVVGAAPSPTGEGYWLVAADGGVFAFGDADFLGSLGRRPPPRSAVAITAGGDNGYWVATRNGEVFEFGIDHHGGATESRQHSFHHAPVVDIAGVGDDGGYWLVHGEALVLDRPDEGPEVESLQRRLTDLGYWLGDATGTFGPLTEQAVYAFQKYEGLPVTGRYDPATQEALDRARRPVPGNTTGDRIEVDKARQLLLVVRGGQMVWAFNTSTGEEEPYRRRGRTYQAETPAGQFRVLWEIDGWRTSHLGRLYRPKYFTETGIAVHGFTHVPPHPASKGCVRVTLAAMDFIWDSGFMPIGSEVWVHGEIPR